MSYCMLTGLLLNKVSCPILAIASCLAANGASPAVRNPLVKEHIKYNCSPNIETCSSTVIMCTDDFTLKKRVVLEFQLH